jgi:hypothetical protein
VLQRFLRFEVLFLQKTMSYHDVLDVFQQQNFIFRRTGTGLVVMILGEFSNLRFMIMTKFFILNFSLPYLDPTDPFFQQVGVALLNEVG